MVLWKMEKVELFVEKVNRADACVSAVCPLKGVRYRTGPFGTFLHGQIKLQK